MPAICFLCGSAGREPLLFCCQCCEPYHLFCLEPAPKNLNAHEQCYDWLCPRCTTCNACGEADKQKLNCQRCNKAYHPECFNTKWQTDDRPTVMYNLIFNLLYSSGMCCRYVLLACDVKVAVLIISQNLLEIHHYALHASN